jgi:hypothetical protein
MLVILPSLLRGFELRISSPHRLHLFLKNNRSASWGCKFSCSAIAVPYSPFAIEALSHALRQIFEGERLCDQADAGIEAAVMHDGIAAVAGGEQNLEPRVAAHRDIGQFAAVHAAERLRMNRSRSKPTSAVSTVFISTPQHSNTR